MANKSVLKKQKGNHQGNDFQILNRQFAAIELLLYDWSIQEIKCCLLSLKMV